MTLLGGWLPQAYTPTVDTATALKALRQVWPVPPGSVGSPRCQHPSVPDQQGHGQASATPGSPPQAFMVERPPTQAYVNVRPMVPKQPKKGAGKGTEKPEKGDKGEKGDEKAPADRASSGTTRHLEVGPTPSVLGPSITIEVFQSSIHSTGGNCT